MKILYLEISNCGQCPYKSWDSPDDHNGGRFICRKADKEIIGDYEYTTLVKGDDGPIIGRDYTPDWCTLPEYP